MRPVDIGLDAARTLEVAGPGRVRAVFTHALYLQARGGLVALVTTRAPRGPLHVRVDALPAVGPGCPVLVGAGSLRIGEHRLPLDAPVWSPRLPAASSFALVRPQIKCWLPDRAPTLDIAPIGDSRPPAYAPASLRHDDLLEFARAVGGRGPGLTPAGDDMLAGVLLVARVLRSASARMLRLCAVQAPTNDIARAFLLCAARGRCIEPAHELLTGLAARDEACVKAAVFRLRRFGSSSGAALAYGIRTALLLT